MSEQNTILPNMTLEDFKISRQSLPPTSIYNVLWILIDIIFIYVVIFFIIKIANVLTKYIEFGINPPILLLIIHLFIICILYYFVRIFTPFISLDIAVAVIMIGPMLGTLSDYFRPFTILFKQIVDGKKKIKYLFI